jgi:GNAT superfamily N-acetyltransferase
MLEDPAEILLVYEEDGGAEEVVLPGTARILGTISLHFIPQIALQGDFARISYFSVDGNARGRGIGQEMEAYCTQLARERGCELIEVHCHSRRVRAHAFYYRQGFEESPKYLIKRLK